MVGAEGRSIAVATAILATPVRIEGKIVSIDESCGFV